ncbi:RHS repeat-associated core domain-containing protein [Amycolatopsis xylanica]|uniref:RHS repeat-associated core domain-containing protein n=2 Tax=Amycolatopsis xylanica TaxID=589385 RepID=A0A1H3RCY1_9PSEU|nr:RHS repeat-associated core domain-containing protein [Amycolatopsis xylanica]
MGEKFSANPMTGTASLSVPVVVTPAREGATPQLTLAYDSGAGNGPFGLGWSLDVASVSRRTDKGLPRYLDDGAEADVFQLTGAEDLVPVPGGTYRPRTEGLFSRIERVRDPLSGALWWRVTSKDNTVSRFGSTARARVADPTDPARVYRWLLEETLDEHGNLVRYEYKADGAQQYLKRVRYGNRTPDGDFCFELVLDYGEHDEVAPSVAETSPWSSRQDAFSTRRPGFEVRTARLCRRILLFHDFAELGAAPVLVASTDLAYAEDPASTKLTSVTHTGYLPDGDGYTKDHLPPLTFGYTPRVVSPVEGTVTPGPGDSPPRADGAYRWADLDGDGLAGLLAEQDGAWYYRANRGGGAFGPPRAVDPLPSGSGLSRESRLLDLAGDGRQVLVRLAGAAPGYHRRTEDRNWAGFRHFEHLPRLDWNDPNLRFVDLTGDGLADVLRTASDGLTWHPSLGLDGYADSRWLPAARNEERGPRLVFADPVQSVYLADMTGDGLTDLVRVGNGEVSYWPNLGYGRFGPRIVMVAAPLFDHPDRFEQRRVHLSDVDGSGPADLVYLGSDGVRVWFNQAGNSWSTPEPITRVPIPEPDGTGVFDLLGAGTACLVRAEQRPDSEPQIRYLDLMSAGKPHLLTTVDNGMGLTTTVRYASSTALALADEAAGRPWSTRLPFPVLVVAEMTVEDAVADTTLVTGYRYRHGFYDSVEREFRGFGYLEQRDALSFGGQADRLRQPPAVVKRWQHTGWYPDADRISTQFAAEYWHKGFQALLSDTVVPPGLSTEDEREAVRALRGRVLREEVFTENEFGELQHPHTVTETNYGLRVLQPRGRGTNAVVFACAGETVTVQVEQDSDDPRIGHTLTLDVDDWGNVLRTASVAYPRRGAGDPEQLRQHVTLAEHDVRNSVTGAENWRVGISVESRNFEVGGLTRKHELFTAKEITDGLLTAADIPFHENLSGDAPQRRLLSRDRQTYYAADRQAELPLGRFTAPLLACRSYQQVFDPEQARLLYGGRVTDQMLADAGYLKADDAWWLASGRQVFDPEQFDLATSSIDSFGSVWQLGYDRHLLRPTRIADPVGNASQVSLNYRVLQPWLLTDPNGNRTGVRFDHLGMVVATALLGKGEGDSLDLSTVEASAADRPTSWLRYDLVARPVRFAAFTRERHVAADSPVQESWTYGDGTGRTVLTKVQAEPPASGGPPRWIGTGRTVYDNKGNPIMKYEPYFAADNGYDTDPELVERGVTTILRYDALSRPIGTEFPDGTLTRVTLHAWEREDHDRNDTVLDSDWYATRATLPATDPRRQAADAAAQHAGTALRTFFDTLGRAHIVRADNGAEKLDTVVDRDVQGNELATTDPRGVVVLRQEFDMLGRVAHAVSPDSGERWVLADVMGKPLYTWDGRGTRTRMVYDPLRRLTHSYAMSADTVESLRVRTFYGEQVTDAAARNLKTRPCLVFDGAGVQRTVEFDFKGNPLASERRLGIDPQGEPDWTPLAEITRPEAAMTAATAQLETTAYTTATVYDALDRPTLVTSPDGSRTRPRYNVGGKLEAIDVQTRGSSSWTPFLTNIDYNARRQRILVERGNGARTVFGYEPDTFRLASADSKDATGGVLQSLRYTYDPVGNVIAAADPAQDTVFYRNSAVSSVRNYRYDPLYRLHTATGREHIGQTGQPSPRELDFGDLPHANDVGAVRAYTETYGYDRSGNLIELAHAAAGGSWTRRHSIDATSNRLLGSSIPGDEAGTFSARYSHDPAGNIRAMPHLSALDWNVDDRLAHADLGGGGDAYYQYDATGARIRATVTRGGMTETRVYLGTTELYVKAVGGATRIRKETLHVADGADRVALVETTTVDNGIPVPRAVPVLRFQLGDSLGSSTIELDEASAILTYEEYHPFGTTSFHAVTRQDLSHKRYRFTGKERDEETGFYFFGARYYAPWLARWTAPDPAGLADGPGRYSYVRNNPVRLIDPNGGQSRPAEADAGAPEPPIQDGGAGTAPPGGGVKTGEGGYEFYDSTLDLNRMEETEQTLQGVKAGIANSAIELAAHSLKSAVRSPVKQLSGGLIPDVVLDRLPLLSGAERHIDALAEKLHIDAPNTQAGVTGLWAGMTIFNTALNIATGLGMRAIPGMSGGASAAPKTPTVESPALPPKGTQLSLFPDEPAALPAAELPAATEATTTQIPFRIDIAEIKSTNWSAQRTLNYGGKFIFREGLDLNGGVQASARYTADGKLLVDLHELGGMEEQIGTTFELQMDPSRFQSATAGKIFGRSEFGNAVEPLAVETLSKATGQAPVIRPPQQGGADFLPQQLNLRAPGILW